jgi:hypothetical protein
MCRFCKRFEHLGGYDFCLFQIYNKFSQQVLYVKLDQFAKGNQRFFFETHVGWWCSLLQFQISQKKDFMQHFVYFLKRYYVMLTLLLFLPRTYVQMG